MTPSFSTHSQFAFRFGTDVDAKNLVERFKALHFDVVRHDNLKALDMLATVAKEGQF